MCVKSNHLKTVFLLMHFPASVSRPTILGIVKQYPLYRQIYEDTKHTQLNGVQMERLGFQPPYDGVVRMFKLDVPLDKLF
jgi:hypothetical protein